MPAARTRLIYTRRFTEREYARIARGFNPTDMDDRWFIFLQGHHLRFHRSWTGFCIYDLVLGHDNGGALVLEAWVNRDKTEYNWSSDKLDSDNLDSIIDNFLLDDRMSAPMLITDATN